MSRLTPERKAEIQALHARLQWSSDEASAIRDLLAELDAVRAECARLADLACAPEGAVDMRVHLMLAAEVGRIESRVAALEARAETPTSAEAQRGKVLGAWKAHSHVTGEWWHRFVDRGPAASLYAAVVQPVSGRFLWWATEDPQGPFALVGQGTAATVVEAQAAADAWLREHGWTLTIDPGPDEALFDAFVRDVERLAHGVYDMRDEARRETRAETPPGHPELMTAGPWTGSPEDGWQRERIRADGSSVTVAWARRDPNHTGWWRWSTAVGHGGTRDPLGPVSVNDVFARTAADAWLRERGWTLEGEP